MKLRGGDWQAALPAFRFRLFAHFRQIPCSRKPSGFMIAEDKSPRMASEYVHMLRDSGQNLRPVLR